MRCSPAHPLAPEEIEDLRKYITTQRVLKHKCEEEGSASEADLPYECTDNHEISNGSDSSNNDADKTAWIGTMIEAPAGELGHATNAHGRLGFKNEDILKHARITCQKWGQYMVSGINILFRTLLLIHYSLLPTDSLTTTSISRRTGERTSRAIPMHGMQLYPR
jgi:hypothetical protein